MQPRTRDHYEQKATQTQKYTTKTHNKILQMQQKLPHRSKQSMKHLDKDEN